MYPDEMYRQGVVFLQREGVPRNPEKAAALFLLAAELGEKDHTL
jgi:TPR repeat protein